MSASRSNTSNEWTRFAPLPNDIHEDVASRQPLGFGSLFGRFFGGASAGGPSKNDETAKEATIAEIVVEPPSVNDAPDLSSEYARGNKRRSSSVRDPSEADHQLLMGLHARTQQTHDLQSSHLRAQSVVLPPPSGVFPGDHASALHHQHTVNTLAGASSRLGSTRGLNTEQLSINTAASRTVSMAGLNNSDPQSARIRSLTRSRARQVTSQLSQRLAAVFSNGEDNQLKDYNDSEFRQYWMPDAHGKECYECQEKFTTLRRRHHCRICGQIFCTKCCNVEIPGRFLGYMGDLRLCNFCVQSVMQYVANVEDSRYHVKRDNTSGSETPSQLASPVSTTRPTMSTEQQPTPTSVTSNGSPFVSTVGGAVGVQWPSAKQHHTDTNRYGKSSPPKMKINMKHAAQTSDEDHPAELSVLDLVGESGVTLVLDQKDLTHDHTDIDELEPDWVKNIEHARRRCSLSALSKNAVKLPTSGSSSAYVRGLSTTSGGKAASARVVPLFESSRVTDNSAQTQLSPRRRRSVATLAPLSPPTAPQPDASTMSQCCAHQKVVVRDADGHVSFSTASNSTHLFSEQFERNAHQLLAYLLSRAGLPVQDWHSAIWPLALDVAHTVQPDVRRHRDSMDILKYVHIKALCTRQPVQQQSHCNAQVLFGSVCTKTVVDSRMAQHVQQPAILVIKGALEYERIGGKFSSIDPVITQESAYLKNMVHRIVSLRPDVLVVEKTVAQVAKTYLRDAGVSLLNGFTDKQLARIARCTQAEMVPFIESGQFTGVKLGTCGHFRCETLQLHDGAEKQMVVFDGCQPDLQCTILLYGQDAKKLKSVKQIVRYLIRMLYSARLEAAMLYTYRLCRTPSMQPHKCSVCNARQRYAITFEHDPSVARMLMQQLSDDPNKAPTEHSSSGKLLSLSQAASHSVLSLSASIYIWYCRPFAERENDSLLMSYFKQPLYKYNAEVLAQSKVNTKRIKQASPGRALDKATSWESMKDESRQSPAPNWMLDSDDEDDETAATFSDTIRSLTRSRHHAFLDKSMTRSVAHPSCQVELARYRAQSSRQFRRRLKDFKKTVNKPCTEGSSDDLLSMADDTNTSAKRPSISPAVVHDRDALSPYNHQRLAVLFGSYAPRSANAPLFCVRPWEVLMQYYGRHDMPLGEFLNRYCFNPTYKCPSPECDVPMLDHWRKIVHGHTCIEITTQVISNAPAQSADLLNQPGANDDGSIFHWQWCNGCSCTTKATQMLDAFWHVSFAKFLEYLCNGHSLMSSHTGNITSALSTAAAEGTLQQNSSLLSTSDLCPHCVWHCRDHYFGQRRYITCFKVSPIVVYEINFAPMMCSVSVCDVQLSTVQAQAQECAQRAQHVWDSMHAQLNDARANADAAKYSSVLEQLVLVCDNGSSTVGERQTQLQALIESAPANMPSADAVYLQMCDAVTRCRQLLSLAVMNWNSSVAELQQQQKRASRTAMLVMPVASSHHLQANAVGTGEQRDSSTNRSSEALSSTDVSEALDTAAAALSLSPTTRQRNASASERTGNAAQTVKPPAHEDPPPGNLKKTHSQPSIAKNAINPLNSETVLNVLKQAAHEASKSQSDKQAEQARKLHMTNLALPFNTSDHYALPCGRMPVVVRDGDIGSIIAYALTSNDYEAKRKQMRDLCGEEGRPISLRIAQAVWSAADQLKPQMSTVSGESIAHSSSGNSVNGAATGGTDAGDGAAASQPFDNQNQHIEVEFADSTAKFYCKVYYAEHFRLLRKLMFTNGEDAFVRSLSRSQVWSPKGGKSGAAWHRTSDRRFVFKTLARLEMQSFLKFAPNYFHYLSTAATENKLTSLAKIYGVYQVCYRHYQTGQAGKLYLLTMEYIFYERNIRQVYDLKGSLRNRMASEKPAADLVLLDENFLKDLWHNQFYLYPHAKQALNMAISNDSHFLSANGVMDYSLLVGVDDDSKTGVQELVLGIVDYMRTFTLDKRFESWVKQVAVPGARLPTIISPQQYCTRFSEAIETYFAVAPNQWALLAQEIPY